MSRLPRLLLLTLALTGCVKKLAINAMADALSGTTGGAFTQDDDLELVGDALPFALKLMESVHEQAPRHEPLTLTLASGFTQYAVVYLLWPADQVKATDFDAYEHLQSRGRNLLRRARGYGLQGLELAHPGITTTLIEAPEAALSIAEIDDVPLLYWTGAAWLAGISVSKEDPAAIGELPVAAALIQRALALDESWDKGAIHEILIQLEPSLPMPGGKQRARDHFARAIELNGGTRASTYLALATSVCVPDQNRAEFEELLGKALAIDPLAIPAEQLATTYAQEQAHFLLDRADDLFVDWETP